MPPATERPEEPVPVPREVQSAVKLWIASLVVGIVSSILSYTLTDPYTAVQQQTFRSRSAGRSTLSQSHAFVTVIVVMAVVFAVLGIALQVFFLLKLRAGRNWARIVLTVWFGFGVAGILLSAAARFIVHTTPLTLVAGVLTVVLLGVAVRLMYRPAANAYFAPAQVLCPADPRQHPPWGQQPYSQQSYPQQSYPQRFEVVVPSSYAPWHTRALSGLIDHGVPTIIFLVFYVPFGSGTHGMGGNQGLLIMLAVIAVLIAVQVYNSAFRQGSTGQSWGKQVARTRLIDEWTGRPLGAGRAFLRLLAHFLDSAACFLGWLFPLWDRPKRQTLADKIMHSIVVPADEAPRSPQRGH